MASFQFRFTKHLFVLLLTTTLLHYGVSAYGPQKYCCQLTKCRIISKACEAEQSNFNGSTCSQKCRPEMNCAALDSLATKDYSCFEPFLNNTDHAPSTYVCGQSYRDGRPAARQIETTYDICATDCSGWRMSMWSKPSEWAASLLQFILPAIIFSMTIPRRRKLEVFDKLFDFDINREVLRVVPSFLGAGLIVTIDTLLWVFIIFAGAGPMLVGGIHEAVLDGRIVMHLNDHIFTSNPNNLQWLSETHKAQLLLAVVSGNLDLNIGNVETELRSVIVWNNSNPHDPLTQRKKTTSLTCLLNMMTSQYSFGSIVGAPVLFYIGAFLYGVTELSGNKGDNDTAHALAFGMWWVVIVHVSIVSGCLLASNNPSSAMAVVSGSITVPPVTATQVGGHPVRVEQSSRSWWQRFYPVPIYETPFQPVNMWDRGCMKKCWVEQTDVWDDPETVWFKQKIEIGRTGYFWIGFSAFLLILVPASLAFIVSFNTPRVCLSCRSLTFTVYTGSQLVLITIATLRSSSYQNTNSDMSDLWEEIQANFTRAKNEGGLLGFIARVIGLPGAIVIALAAIAFSTFTGFAGTLMQVIGVYRNCKCFISVFAWPWPQSELINFASDTQEMRDSSKYWSGTGWAAIGFLGAVCYVGWWYQRHLRTRFLARVVELGNQN